MDFFSLVNITAALVLLLLVGILANKIGVIDSVASKMLSKLIIRIGQPLLVLSAILKVEYSKENLLLGLETFFIGIVVYAVMAFIAYFACKGIRNLDDRKVTEAAMILGNVGFFGFPLLEAALGPQGLFMAVFFNISYNIVCWTWGISIYARNRSDIKLNIRKILINNGTVPGLIAVLVYALRIPLPEFLTTSISYLSGICTPISMLVTGALIATIAPKRLLTNGKVYYSALFRLIVLPLVICFLMKLCGFDHMHLSFYACICAVPVAANVTMFSELYDTSASYAAHNVGLSSLLSILSLPLVMFLAEKIAALPF